MDVPDDRNVEVLHRRSPALLAFLWGLDALAWMAVFFRVPGRAGAPVFVATVIALVVASAFFLVWQVFFDDWVAVGDAGLWTSRLGRWRAWPWGQLGSVTFVARGIRPGLFVTPKDVPGDPACIGQPFVNHRKLERFNDRMRGCCLANGIPYKAGVLWPVR